MMTPESHDSGEPVDLIDAAKLQIEEMRDRRSGVFANAGSSFRGDDRGISGFLSDSLPGYVVGSEIHRGGQGVVYQATQSSTGRTVAIKITRQGVLASRNDQIRLEREVQILGSLHHRNIVSVIDTGSSAGHHYFVMDFVDGRPLDEHAAGLSQPKTLELFAKICDAVHAAHLRGVIHRDLKPGNILIDANGEPNILDFGLAKIIAHEQALASDTVVTQTGQFIGSLPWASPEQAAGGASGAGGDEAIDIRSDVYALGVMLYQVLTGKFPYRVIGAMRDVLDNIINIEPARPSAINHAIDDEVETIVLKCLCKEPQRRYQSAGELGRDLRHYLADEPIEAKRDSFTYLVRKQLQRHRIAVAIAAGFVLLIAAGVVASVTLWQAAIKERDQKESQRTRAESINGVLHNMLASANPEISSVSDVLANAASEIEGGSLRDHPEVEASIRLTMGKAYLALGKLDTASQHLQRALQLIQTVSGLNHVDSAEYLNALGELRRAQGNPTEAATLHRQALELLQIAHGNDHQDVADTLTHLALTAQDLGQNDEARQHLEQALAMTQRIHGDRHPKTATAKVRLAINMHGGEQPVRLLREAIEINRAALGPRHPDIPRTLQYLAAMLHMQRDYPAAERTYLEAIDLATQIHGPDHPNVIKSVQNLCWLYQSTNQNDKRLELLKQHQAAAEGAFGRNSVLYADYLNSLGATLAMAGDYVQASADLEEALSILKVIGRDKEWLGAECRNSLTVIHLRTGRNDEAERLARETIALHADSDSDSPAATSGGVSSPHDDRMHAQAQSLLGEALVARHEFIEAETVLLAGYEGLVKARATAVYRTTAMERLVRLYEAWDGSSPNTGKAELAAHWRLQQSIILDETKKRSIKN